MLACPFICLEELLYFLISMGTDSDIWYVVQVLIILLKTKRKEAPIRETKYLNIFNLDKVQF